MALFVMFGLLYLHAYRKRHELGLTPLEVFNVRSFAGQQIVSAAVGVIVVLIAVAAPRRYAFISPMAFILMWPAHTLYEMRIQKKAEGVCGPASTGYFANSALRRIILRVFLQQLRNDFVDECQLFGT